MISGPIYHFFVHGGVSFEPYKKGFEKLISKPLTYIETYLSLRRIYCLLVTANMQKACAYALSEHIFFEFVPFNDENFDVDGNIKPEAQTLTINEIEEGINYAIIIKYRCGGMEIFNW